MTLKTDEREAIVAYRMEKAIATAKEAEAVYTLKYWSLAANRLYYAAYYASVALLIHSQIEAATHKGVIRMIGQTFVKNGLLNKEDGSLLGRLFSMRQTGDYEDFFDWEENDVKPLISKVKDYIDRIKILIAYDSSN